MCVEAKKACFCATSLAVAACFAFSCKSVSGYKARVDVKGIDETARDHEFEAHPFLLPEPVQWHVNSCTHLFTHLLSKVSMDWLSTHTARIGKAMLFWSMTA